MKKIGFLILIIIIISGVLFIPVTNQKTVTVKALFFNTYQQLSSAGNWLKWRRDLRPAWMADSSKISVTKTQNGFDLKYRDSVIHVAVNGYSLYISETGNPNYAYTVFPDTNQNKTNITVFEQTNILNYLFKSDHLLSDTHITDLKGFLENPDLYYGYQITKIKVTDTALVVLNRVVLDKLKFTTAQQNLAILKQYIAANGLKQTQPFIAQFLPKQKDSVLVNIGVPVNRNVIPRQPIHFMRMPPYGNLYTLKYHGKFKDRVNAFSAMRRFFTDRQLPMPILPFETYLDNKLPLSENDTVNIKLNFSTF